MPSAGDIPFDSSGLARAGFLVVPGFLGTELLAELRRDFASLRVHENRNYPVKQASPRVVSLVRPRLESVAARVAADTDVRVDRVSGATYFSTLLGFDSGWHQDHESYFLFQEHYHYLNFWIPIDKPSRDLTNLAVVPIDSLRARAPQVAERIVGRGACRSRQTSTGTHLLLDETGETLSLGFDLEELEVCPALDAGDLLLLRGDILHRTQDTKSQRTAVSFRMLRAGTPVSRRRLLTGSKTKREMLLKNPWDYVRALRLLNAAGGRDISAGSLLDAFERGERDPLGTLRALAQLALRWRRS